MKERNDAMKNILCFGDSNTWGFIPETKERFPEGVRWTSLLQNKLSGQDLRVLEEGLCGRTTIFEDKIRPNRKGIDSLVSIIDNYDTIDYVVLMLGTNDCKSCYHNSAKTIAKGIENCLDIILDRIPAENVLLISPIWLGEDVWKEQYDPEFDRESVEVSKQLKKEYCRVAKERNIKFLAASDYVLASPEDQEHMSAKSHSIFADVVFEALKSA